MCYVDTWAVVGSCPPGAFGVIAFWHNCHTQRRAVHRDTRHPTTKGLLVTPPENPRPTNTLPPALATRVAMVLADRDEGERRIPWAVLTRMGNDEVRLFRNALIHAMAADPKLEVKALGHRNAARGIDELVIQWRRRG